MLRRKSVDAEIPEKVVQRCEKLSREDLITWSDQAIYSAGRSLTMYARGSREEDLKEAHTAAQVLLAITTEIARRR